MAPNKLRKPPQAPPTFLGSPTSIIDDTKRLIDVSRKVQDYIVGNVHPETARFANVLLPLAHVENSMALETHVLSFYKDVSTNSELRHASIEAQKLLDNFAVETAMREDLFELVDAIPKKNEDIDPESNQLLEKSHKDYVRNGLQLPAGSRRDRFKEIKRRLIQLCLDFRNNLIEENGGVWFTRQELEGVQEDVISGLEKGNGENEGKLRLTFKYPDLYPALRYARKGETRKRFYIAHENKCIQNVPIFKETIVLRDEAARLLGYPNHAAFSIEDKMAKKPEAVDAFLNDLRSRMTSGGRKELENLKRLKKADLETQRESFDGQFYIWDYGFYNRLMLEKYYLVDQQKIAEYFPLQTTIRCMLEIFQNLFGLVFEEIRGEEGNKLRDSGKGDDIVWHDEVQVFSVWDNDEQGGEFVGYLYLDLFPREGKYGHAANFNLQPGFIQEDGTRHYPATALVCNFTKPTLKKPSLLRHDEVVTLFHELGHGIHDLVSKTIYSRFHGTNTVIDFGEAPSQMLENWCWTPSQLKSLSRHYSSLSTEYFKSWEGQAEEKAKPPERIPDEVTESLIRAKYVNSAMFHLRQLHIGIFDMTVHEPESHEAVESLNISAKYNNLLEEILGIGGPKVSGQENEWGHGQANLGHLMDCYDAGYYSYLSSKVYSTDMFYTIFKQDPMNSREGRRYRHTVLEKGGSQDEMKTLTEFLGREPKTEAFYKELGLAL